MFVAFKCILYNEIKSLSAKNSKHKYTTGYLLVRQHNK